MIEYNNAKEPEDDDFDIDCFLELPNERINVRDLRENDRGRLRGNVGQTQSVQDISSS